MKKLVYSGLWAVALGTVLAAVSIPASAQLASPRTALGVTEGNDLLTEVQFRGRGGFRGGYRGGYGGYRGGYRYGGWRGPGVGLGIGLATGALIGGALAAPYYYDPYYYAPAPRVYGAPDDAVAYCMQRFRSYDPASGTYVGYDGLRHPCP